MRIRWPRLTFPPINLWSAPHQSALEDTMTAVAERDDVQEQLCARIDELEREKEALAVQLDKAEEELAEEKRARAVMRDTFASQVQQAVARARRDWAAHGSPWVKARWQAEALSEMIAAIPFSEELARDMLKHRRDQLRQQAEEASHAE